MTEKRKFTRYGQGALPLVMETYGRLGEVSQHTLVHLARCAAAMGTSRMSPFRLARQWRIDLEHIHAFMAADAVLLSRGALSSAAGAERWPIGRLLRFARSGGGEQEEH